MVLEEQKGLVPHEDSGLLGTCDESKRTMMVLKSPGMLSPGKSRWRTNEIYILINLITLQDPTRQHHALRSST